MAKRIATILGVILLASSLRATNGEPDLNSCDFKCGPIDCDTTKNNPGLRYDQLVALLSETNNSTGFRAIELVREDFQESYDSDVADKEWNAKEREAFAEQLFAKDIYYLKLHLSARLMSSDTSGLADLTDQKLDGGIPDSARPEFDAWVDATRDALVKLHGAGDLISISATVAAGASSEEFRRATNLAGKEYQDYLMERDWSEFERYGRLPWEFRSPKMFGPLLYFRFGKVKFRDALAIYGSMKDVLGKDLVEAAADAVHRAPKKQDGRFEVTVPKPVKKGPGGSEVDDYDAAMPDYVIGAYRDPLVTFEVLATYGDDYRYAIYLLKSQYQPNRQLLDPGLTKWTFAKNVYDSLVSAFGKDAVLQAAHAVRVAKKRVIHGTVIGEKAIGATRNEPWEAFEDILARKDPRGYVKAAVMFSENVNTPAKVDAEAGYKKLAAKNGDDKLLAAAQAMAAGKPHFAYPDEARYLKQAIDAPPAPEKPAEQLADFPEYVAWRKFPAGAKVTYVNRVWNARFGAQFQPPAHPEWRSSYTLQSVNDDQVRLWFTETIFDTHGDQRPPRDTEIAYPAKAPVITDPNNTMLLRLFASRYAPVATSTPTEAGTETIVINGRALNTKWESFTAPARDGRLTSKTWTCDDIPTKLVRRTEDITYSRGTQVLGHAITETSLESLDGFAPGAATQQPATKYEPAVPRWDTGTKTATPATSPNPVARQQTPASTSAQRPKLQPLPAPVPPPAGLTPKQAAQFEMTQRYNRIGLRASRVRQGLFVAQRGQAGTPLPADVQDARDKLDAQLKTIRLAMANRDNDQANQAMQSAEDSLTVIEKYVNQ